MAYKFQFGASTMSGALDQEGDLTVVGGALKMGASTLSDTNRNVTALSLSASSTLDVVGVSRYHGLGTFNAGITSTAAANTFGATSFNDANITNVGNIALDSISADGASLSIDSNWDAAGVTCSDLGSVTTADLNGGTIDNMAIGNAVQSSVKATTLSGSGNADIVGTLTVHGLVRGNAGFAGTTLSASSNAVVVGNTLTHGAVIFSGSSIQFYGLADDTNYAGNADSLYYHDATSRSVKQMSNDEFLGKIAGAGLSVAGNKLVTDAAQGVIRWGNASVTLQEGYNVGTASFDADRTWSLPAAPSEGDVVRVKAPSMGANDLIIAKGAANQRIDGAESIVIESNSGSVSLIAVTAGAAAQWSIF